VLRGRRSKQNRATDALRRACNDLAHTPPSQLPVQKANDLLQRIMTSLVALGEDKAELDRFIMNKQHGGISPALCV
jgi:hypothetical protein